MKGEIMYYAGRVRGSYEASRPLIIGPTTVYVHTNIEEVVVEDEFGEREPYTVWEYDEYQYNRDEYFNEKMEANNQLLDDVSQNTSDIAIANDNIGIVKEDVALAQDALDALIMDDEKDNRIKALEEQLAVTQEALDALIMGE